VRYLTRSNPVLETASQKCSLACRGQAETVVRTVRHVCSTFVRRGVARAVVLNGAPVKVEGSTSIHKVKGPGGALATLAVGQNMKDFGNAVNFTTKTASLFAYLVPPGLDNYGVWQPSYLNFELTLLKIPSKRIEVCPFGRLCTAVPSLFKKFCDVCCIKRLPLFFPPFFPFPELYDWCVSTQLFPKLSSKGRSFRWGQTPISIVGAGFRHHFHLHLRPPQAVQPQEDQRFVIQIQFLQKVWHSSRSITEAPAASTGHGFPFLSFPFYIIRRQTCNAYLRAVNA
jgi:hypothetical protein